MILNFLYLFIIIIDLFLCFLVIFKNPRGKYNLIFASLILLSTIWLSTLILFYAIHNIAWVLIIGRLNFFSIVWLIYFLFLFVYFFPKKSIRIDKKVILFFLFETIILSYITLFTGLIDKDEIIVGQERITVYGELYFCFVLHFLSFFIISIYYLLKKYKASLDVEKLQLKYLILGLLISLSFGFITNILIPVIFSFYLTQKFGPFAIPIAIIFITYAIIRYRLMDIRIVVRQVTVYGFSLIISIGLSLLLMLLAINYLSFYISSPWIGSLILIFGIIVFQLVKESFSKFANKHLFFTLYSYEKTLGDLTEKLSRSIDLNRLVSLTTETIKDVMKLDKISLILHKFSPPKGEIKLLNNNHHSQNNHELIKENEKEADFYLAQNNSFEEKYFDGLMKNKILIQYLESSKKPLVKDEIEHLIEEFDNEEDKNIFRKLGESMETIKAHIYLPLIIENHLIGFFILGKKVSGDAYTIQDLNLLETVANQIAIAINNAQLYEQSQYFNQILRVRVAEATQELSGAYRELKKLDDSKTEFLSLASHQLRTPLSAIKGYLSMVMEGNFGKLEKETEGAIKDVYQSNERLIALVNDLLNITRIEAGKLEYHPKETDFEKLVASVIKELEMTAKNKGLELKEKISKLPLINIDPDKIRQVLINLIDNALKYTEKGKVTVQAKKVDDHILVEIKDTGIGMSADKMTTLFQWFSRGKGALRLDAGGFGLGLYIAKKIVEKANGKIWAESKGEKKGSTFVFELPIK